MEKYEELGLYLDHISELYNLNIVVKDFVGFYRWDYELSRVLVPYSIHKSQFCMRIKKEPELWKRCMDCKKQLIKKCMEEGDMFYGMCYGGLEEFVIPIQCEDMYIGVICVGNYCENEEMAFERLESLSQKYDFDLEELKEKLRASVIKNPPERELILKLLGIAAGYISAICKPNFLDKDVTYEDKIGSTSYILAHAIEYIRSHFKENIYVSDISAICHCSESYINHMFKKNMDMNIRKYINNIRIKESKKYLKNGNESIINIAEKCGFSDSNYFATVFGEIMKMSPTQYRKLYGKGKA